MEYLSLYDFCSQISQRIRTAFPGPVWVQAEVDGLRLTAKGYYSLELIQREDVSGGVIAKIDGKIWRSATSQVVGKFEVQTRQKFTNGLKVLVRVQPSYHELYGLSVSVLDIDPNYTLGDIQRNREEILRRLEQDGILTMNKDLPRPPFFQHIAVISSPTAAGYGDFMNQLKGQGQGYYFHTELFPAVMQGKDVESSVIAALDAVYQRLSSFDCVVIIRGGGASSDLYGFDTYPLAASCAQFPLPIVTGIGHERDNTVLDYISAVRVKTPTAAAEYLINLMDEAAGRIRELKERLFQSARLQLQESRNRLQRLKAQLPVSAVRRLRQQKDFLDQKGKSLERSARQILQRQSMYLRECSLRMELSSRKRLETVRHKLEMTRQHLFDVSPDRILEKGYSITLLDGKIVKDAGRVPASSEIEIRLKSGSLTAVTK